MPGLVTSEFRVLNARKYIEMFSGSDNMYFYMGGFTPWTNSSGAASDDYPPSILDDNHDIKAVWNQMIAMKRILPSNVSHALKRNNWTSGITYDRYDEQDGSLHSKMWYVLTSQNQVFACMDNGRILSGGLYRGIPSIYEPYYDSTTPTVNVVKMPDGYVWKYMYTISTSDFLQFTSPSWMPCTSVETLTNKSTGIYSITLSSFGTGYASTPTVTISGDGTGATATAVLSGGQVTQINMTTYGSGYTYATVTITGTNTTTAVARANTMTLRGIGFKPAYDLAAYYVITAAKLNYSESGVFPVVNQYRQFGIIQNPILSDGTTQASATDYNQIYTCKITTSSTFVMDEVVSVAGGTAYVLNCDYSDSANVLMTLACSTAVVINGSVITSGSKTATVVTVNDVPDIKSGSGVVLYAENVSPIYRSSNQTETFLHISEF